MPGAGTDATIRFARRAYGALTRSSMTAGLPERVAGLVRKKDRESEHLLVAVQLMLAAMLGVLYWLAPRPIDAGMPFLAPVPVALACYAVLTLLRAAYVRRAPLPGSGVALSIATDIALLFGLIWSFHITYGQPPAFSLKAPTFAYVFVFIAIRALRFDFRYVLMTGAAAAFGWLMVTALAIALSGHDGVTRSFSDYLLSNRILIGAEFDKIFAILAVTAVLGAATWRAERTLVAAVREEAANREIGRFLSRGVATQIANAEQAITPGEASARDAAIIFLDIRGFTRFSMQEPPAAVVALLTSFHRRIVPVVRANGGVVDKFLGDGVMITFGAVEPSERAAADAFRALEALLGETAGWQAEQKQKGVKTELAVNAALATGPVVFAALGDENRLEYTVIGEAVNLAAKLEKHNKVELSVALAPAASLTQARAQGFVSTRKLANRTGVKVAGVGGAIDLAAWLAPDRL